MLSLLLVFEFLGTTELLVIALVALIIFGPRRLPEIGRTIGRGMAEFKRASEDFKRTWEYEVEMEHRQTTPSMPATPAAQEEEHAGTFLDEASKDETVVAAEGDHPAEPAAEAQTIARGSSKDSDNPSSD